MFSGSKKPYTAITVQIDRLTSEQYEEDDSSGIPDLVDVIRLQSSGPTEAARAIRKKLKYGNPHRQLRALVILDGLIQNAGSRFQRTFADEPLLERLRLLPRDEVVDPQVRQKCRVLFIQWSTAYSNTPGLERIAHLYQELPKTQRPQAARAKVLRDTERFDSDNEPSGSSSPVGRARASSSANQSGTHTAVLTPIPSSSFSSKLSKSKKGGANKAFNLSKEKENMTQAIAQSSIASTNLLNGLQLINRETQRPSENPEVVQRFENCKNLRRRILYYIQHVESDQWIGSLVNANDELVKALTAFEITDRSIDNDSDSDAWEHADTAEPKTSTSPNKTTQQQLAGLSLNEAPPKKPPRPGNMTIPPKPSFPSAPPVESDQSEANPDAINIKSALSKSREELETEDRITDWQKQVANEAQEPIELDTSVRTGQNSRPLDDSGERIGRWEPNQSAGTLILKREKKKSGGISATLKKTLAFASSPVTETYTRVMRMQQRMEELVWDNIDPKCRSRKKAAKAAQETYPTISDCTPPIDTMEDPVSAPKSSTPSPTQDEAIESLSSKSTSVPFAPAVAHEGLTSPDSFLLPDDERAALNALWRSQREFLRLARIPELFERLYKLDNKPSPAEITKYDGTVSRLGMTRSELERFSTKSDYIIIRRQPSAAKKGCGIM